MIVGNANDIFISNMAKWLKYSIKDVKIDIFSWEGSRQQIVDTSYYDNVCETATKYRLSLSNRLLSLYTPLLQARELSIFLRDKEYDIIQCHWITAPLVLCGNDIRNHCKKMVTTFWGREHALMKLFGTNKIFKIFLNQFMQKVDMNINSKSSFDRLLAIFPFMRGKLKEGNLGANAAEGIALYLNKLGKKGCKQLLSIPTDKFSVQIGYSGKELHQHLAIIEEIRKYDTLKTKIHIIAPMTRGANKLYVDLVSDKLQECGCSYTLLRDRFLTDEEVGCLRCATDITLQLSTSDGFSRSIVEAFCAKSLVIYGNWLNYSEHLRNEGCTAISVDSINMAIETLIRLINNYDSYIPMIEVNSRNSLDNNLWSHRITDWVTAYNQ